MKRLCVVWIVTAMGANSHSENGIPYPDSTERIIDPLWYKSLVFNF